MHQLFKSLSQPEKKSPKTSKHNVSQPTVQILKWVVKSNQQWKHQQVLDEQQPQSFHEQKSSEVQPSLQRHLWHGREFAYPYSAGGFNLILKSQMGAKKSQSMIKTNLSQTSISKKSSKGCILENNSEDWS